MTGGRALTSEGVVQARGGAAHVHRGVRAPCAPALDVSESGRYAPRRVGRRVLTPQFESFPNFPRPSFEPQEKREVPSRHWRRRHPRARIPTMPADADTLRFEPWQSAVDPGFWAELARRKLDNAGLSEDPWLITALYTPAQNAVVSSPCQLDARAFGTGDESELAARARDVAASGRLEMPGTLVNVNTLERFRAFDRGTLMSNAAKRLAEDIRSGRADSDAALLTPFIALTYADLKKWSFYYWFAFPALKLDVPAKVISCGPLAEHVELGAIADEISRGCEAMLRRDAGDPARAWWIVDDATGTCEPPSIASVRTRDPSTWTLAFVDPCASGGHPGWALRNVLSWLAVRTTRETETAGETAGAAGAPRRVRVLAVRKLAGRVCPRASPVFECVLPVVSDADVEVPKGVGWEVNASGRPGPRLANLGSSMDPARLASQAVDLNLKLMRWRLLPQLRVAEVASTRCLLLGAGTLGCAVARCLLGWGVRGVTFVDGGDVSFSNPVRQSLFEFEDCLGGGKPKAEAAAKALRRIFPGVNAEGVRMTIPMPGHPVPDADVPAVLDDVRRLEDLIDAHDCVYLLTDTRESRWLPTLVCAAKGKLLINAALGFDSYLVMRHGGGLPRADECTQTHETTDERGGGAFHGRLGCYFCNDVVAPGDSTTDRTLDQQCTVTRPGLAPIAGALAVEMMVAIAHSRVAKPGDGGVRTPAHTHESFNASRDNPGGDVGSDDGTTALGIVPHQIRGGVFDLSQRLFAAPAFDRCVACSAKVVDAFLRPGGRDEFLRRAFDDPAYLENATGLAAMKEEVDDAAWLGEDSDGDDF